VGCFFNHGFALKTHLFAYVASQKGLLNELYSGDGYIVRLLGIPLYLTAPNGTLLRLCPDWGPTGTLIEHVDEICPRTGRQNVTSVYNTNRGFW
jgi:hypothetical protein